VSRTLAEDTVDGMVHTIRPSWTVERIQPTEPRTDAVYYLTAETGDESVEAVLKACTAISPTDFRPEPYLCRLLNRQTSIPVPHIFSIIDSHEEYPSPFYLMEYCEGQCAATIDLTSDHITQIARTAGRHIGEYHTVGEFQRFGRLRLDCDVAHSRMGATIDGRGLAVADAATDKRPEPDTSLWQEYSASSWRAWFESLYHYWIENLDERFTDLRPAIRAFVEARFDTLDRPFTAVLSHIDYKYRNLLVQPETGETTAVLDWGHPTAMEPYYDLIVTEHHLSHWAPLRSSDRRRVREALEEGYSQTNTLEQDPAFEERRQLYLLQSYLQPLVWFSEWWSDTPEAERSKVENKYRQFVATMVD
jgi:aminoglycoside phosphotransferase (APT) family kinase protein